MTDTPVASPIVSQALTEESGIASLLPVCDPSGVHIFRLPAAGDRVHVGVWFSGDDGFEENQAGILIREKTADGWVTALYARERDFRADYLTFSGWKKDGSLRLNGLCGYFADRSFPLTLTFRDGQFRLDIPSLPDE